MDEQLRILIAARDLRRFSVPALAARADVPVEAARQALRLFDDLIARQPGRTPARYRVVRPDRLQEILDTWDAQQLRAHPPRRSTPADPAVAHLRAADCALAAAARTFNTEDRLLYASAAADSAQALLSNPDLPAVLRRDASVIRRAAAVLIASDPQPTPAARIKRAGPGRLRGHDRG